MERLLLELRYAARRLRTRPTYTLLAVLTLSLGVGCMAAISGIGMKTQLKELAAVGLKPVVLMLGETLFLAALVLALLRWGF